MEDKLKLINKSSTYKCPKCGKTVHVSERFDFNACLFRLYAKCINCDYEIDSQREGTLNEIRKEAGLEPIKESGKDTDGDSGQYPCEDGVCVDYKAEYEKLREKNKELEHQIEIYIKVLEEQNSIPKEEYKCCAEPDYKSEYHRAQDEIEALKQELHHCKHIIDHMTHLI